MAYEKSMEILNQYNNMDKLVNRISELESEVERLKTDLAATVQSCKNAIEDVERLKKEESDWQAHHKFLDEESNELYEQVDKLRKALDHVSDCGHNSDCLFCAEKDYIAQEALDI